MMDEPTTESEAEVCGGPWQPSNGSNGAIGFVCRWCKKPAVLAPIQKPNGDVILVPASPGCTQPIEHERLKISVPAGFGRVTVDCARWVCARCSAETIARVDNPKGKEAFEGLAKGNTLTAMCPGCGAVLTVSKPVVSPVRPGEMSKLQRKLRRSRRLS